MPVPQDEGPITLGNCVIIQLPLGDEPIPAGRDSPPLTSPSPFDVIHGAQDPLCIAPMGGTAPDVLTPKRKGGPLRAPTSKEAHTSRDTEEFPEDANPDEYGILL